MVSKNKDFSNAKPGRGMGAIVEKQPTIVGDALPLTEKWRLFNIEAFNALVNTIPNSLIVALIN
jgi:hypothetical protein